MQYGLLILCCAVLTSLSLPLPANAADGPALTQVRTQLPVPGTVMVDAETPADLRPAIAEGSASELVTVEPGAGMPLDRALRMNVAKAYPTPYTVQVFSAPTAVPLHKNDVVLLSCWLRSPEAAGAQGGLAIMLQTTQGQWESPANQGVTCEARWKQVYAVGTAARDYAAGGLQVAMHLGQQRQVIDVAGLVVLNLGPGVDLARLPHTRLTWPGMEPDAPWRAEAQRRIEKYRMADLAVQVVDAKGHPVVGATVQIQQKRRSFTIGSFAGYLLTADTPDGQKIRDTYLRLFNRATTPIYWADWGWPNQKEKFLAQAKWLHDHGFTTRGHVMVYPTFRYMPADIVRLKDNPEQLRQRILQQVREISQATKPFAFREYDVTNELRDCVDVYHLLGRDCVAEWYAEARRQLPEAKLALNENTILTAGGATNSQQDIFLDWYRFLKSKGQAPDVLGLQSHFGEDFTGPEKVWSILDRFARETDAELQITEFDINTLDEEAQANYTRDFMTACFAHPRITGFTMWGFWEGDQWMPRAAFYRKDWSPKPNGKVLEELLTKTWWTNATVKTDQHGRAIVKAFLGTHEVTTSIGGREISQEVNLPTARQPVTVRLAP